MSMAQRTVTADTLRNFVLTYWILFSYFAAAAAWSPRTQVSSERSSKVFLLFGAIATALLIGTRYQVGADYRTYEFLFRVLRHASLERALSIGDPGYQFVGWIVQQMDGQVWWVNVFCAAIFISGIYRLSSTQPSPALALVVTVPYLIIVVGMGYTRQSVALGILMLGLASLQRGASVIRFSGYVAVAALFHKTAVLVLPLVIFASQRNRLLTIIASAAIFVLLFDLLLSDSADQLVRGYVEARYSSQGAWIRVILLLIPAFILLFNRGRFGFTQAEEKVWRFFAYASCALPVLLIATPSSTAVDRMALYLMPLQVVLLSRAFLLFKNHKAGMGAVITFSFLVQFVWLNFATHARYWVPYRSIVFEDPYDR